MVVTGPNAADRMEKLGTMAKRASEMFESIRLRDELVNELLERWANLEGQNPNADKFFVPNRLESAVRRFIKLLSVEEVSESMEIAFEKLGHKRPYSIFKYFCGICWKKLKYKKEGICTSKSSSEFSTHPLPETDDFATSS